jgi:TM2 domain-containing membrane protein YozV
MHNNHCAYKIDLFNAYDRVYWGFLEKALAKLGFCQTWIKWIMVCIRSVIFAVKVNGATLELVPSTRGLRHGCPLSPY